MYSVGAHQDFFEIYQSLGTTYQLPLMINEQLITMTGLNPEKIIKQDDILSTKVLIGNFDLFASDKLYDYYSKTVQHLVPGLNVLLIHPAYNDKEMQGITVNHPNFGAEWRQVDLDFFSDIKNSQLFEKEDIQLVNWNQIKTLI
jgi:hypothetical protein